MVYLTWTGYYTFTASVVPFDCALLEEEFGGKILILHLPLLHVNVPVAKACYQFAQRHIPQDWSPYVVTTIRVFNLATEKRIQKSESNSLSLCSIKLVYITYKFQFILHREHIMLLSDRTVCGRCVEIWSLFVIILRKTYVYCLRQFRVSLLLELRPRMGPFDIPRMIDEWKWSIVEIITGREILKYSGNFHPSVILSTTNPKGTGCMWSPTSLKNILISLRVLFPRATSPLEPTVKSKLRLQVSDCSTFRIMCDVPGSCLV